MQIELWMLIPFAVTLLGIAVCPLIAPHWWEKSRNMMLFTAVLSVPTAAYLVWIGLGESLVHQIFFDYVPFIILLTALFVVTGGIHIRYNTTATPLVNSVILLAGYNIASFIGTTGAAMLLIRPLLEINRSRKHKVHTILFFIAMVANCGGILSPLGDPPLFLLYLRGTPFEWFVHLFPEWAVVGAILLVIYFLTDLFFYHRDTGVLMIPDVDDDTDTEEIKVSLSGAINVLYIIAIVTAVAFVNESYIPIMGEHECPIYLKFLREEILLVIIWLSLATTRRRVRKKNNFSWGPIVEVAILFVGIFTTMTPALLYLNVHASELGMEHPWQFFYATGLLSSFLDNAPTAVAFHTVATGLPMAEGVKAVAAIPETLLRAISLGAVFFGAMTYIGNGPNFMVKAIAEREGVRMPSFFGYIFTFSLVVLLPVYVVVQLLFL